MSQRGTVYPKLCHDMSIAGVGDMAECAQFCVHVCGGGKALSASPSLQHSLSFTPGRLLRNVSGREAKNILSPPSAHGWG